MCVLGLAALLATFRLSVPRIVARSDTSMHSTAAQYLATSTVPGRTAGLQRSSAARPSGAPCWKRGCAGPEAQLSSRSAWLHQRRQPGGTQMAPAPAAAAAGAAPAGEQQQQQEPRTVVQLKAVDISAEKFKPFGQLVGATDDGKHYDEEDAQLDLAQGQPRFYIMRLPRRGRTFDRITYHAKVTQCLGGLQPGSPWFMVVARPTLSVEQYPQQDDLAAFRIPHGVFVKLHKGTWHAGPLFDGEWADFYNLELSDTNVVDHNTHDYRRAEGLAFEVVD